MIDSPHDASPQPLQEPAALRPHHQDALQRFVLFWGEMASNWGINRTMAQIHALLYVTETPMDTDTIMERLQISRGNANMNLRSLVGWSLAKKVHVAGSRKDFFTAEKDVWQITAQIIREREKRELKPVMQQLVECREVLLEGGTLSEEEQVFLTRLDNMRNLMEISEAFSKAVLPLVEFRNVALLKQFATLAESLGRLPDLKGTGQGSGSTDETSP
ncbi:MAG: hypothetical protein AAGI71_09300 [Bacteroidota bacterium]